MAEINKRKKLLLRDAQKTIQQFPTLSYFESQIQIGLKGNLLLRDNNNYKIEEYELKMFYTDQFPYAYPAVQEISGKIPRVDDWHSNEAGILCITVKPLEILYCMRGITSLWFIKEKLIPHLFLQTYRRFYNEYPIRGYGHKSKGLLEAYSEICEEKELTKVSDILNRVIENKIPSRNDDCFCGSKKSFKNCHERIINQLKIIGVKYLREHLQNIQQLPA